jgi:hypothetical protein
MGFQENRKAITTTGHRKQVTGGAEPKTFNAEGGGSGETEEIG